MYDEIVRKIIEAVGQNLTADHPVFSGEGYKSSKIDIKNFHEVNKKSSSKKIAFVDGGNAEIIASANLSLSLVRACCLIYQNNKKMSINKFEIFVFMQSVSHNDEIHYKASFFNAKNSIDMEELSFNSLDHTLMIGINRAEISSIANAIRRFVEIKVANLISDQKLADIIVLDGNLQSTITNENKFLSRLYESCIKNNIILTALSKTTSLFTDNGNSLGIALDRISPFASWYYYPIAEIKSSSHQAEMFFLKLHSKSKHVFRFEIFNRQKSEGEEVINILANNCIDPVFIGYPYGLVEADKVARVPNHEREAFKIIFLVKLKNRDIEKYLSSVNAHEILDKISF